MPDCRAYIVGDDGHFQASESSRHPATTPAGRIQAAVSPARYPGPGSSSPEKVFKCATSTPLIEPLSLDEVYLDVTENLQDIPLAIGAKIKAETGHNASAGIATWNLSGVASSRKR
jgi:nucleotidyltransferase/DNA polymerase involved in DNA repair